ncbi:uncharacterized protein CC84DRAFT_161759 [Paraphaeosphaeria sporulosa]|uniref:Uncharacterized protein n=1 Tax=Paraphaeosphaeria sporulosa TaxID=1460663 RepID=A0A177D0D3_9PLEO|nr:uncharacterized protein CC84DRAFT_161759 [Paraphaeosphaeria sporulosa]OAG12848.1 hypothetical protein CC84DRAFT_161759 [Paraphaeosphaeria sporulosa]
MQSIAEHNGWERGAGQGDAELYGRVHLIDRLPVDVRRLKRRLRAHARCFTGEGSVHGQPRNRSLRFGERASWPKRSDVGVRGAGRRSPPATGHQRLCENWSPSPPAAAKHLQLVQDCDFACKLHKQTSLQLDKATIGCGAEFLHSFHYFPPASPALVYYLQLLRISSPSTQP